MCTPRSTEVEDGRWTIIVHTPSQDVHESHEVFARGEINIAKVSCAIVVLEATTLKMCKCCHCRYKSNNRIGFDFEVGFVNRIATHTSHICVSVLFIIYVSLSVQIGVESHLCGQQIDERLC